jgi:hypothetical protein
MLGSEIHLLILWAFLLYFFLKLSRQNRKVLFVLRSTRFCDSKTLFD